MTWSRVAVIGCGLIGGSLAAALKRAGRAGTIAGADASQEVAEAAQALGLIDEALAAPAAAVARADLVVLAVPVGAVPAVIDEIAAVVREDVLVTDVGSTKRAVLAAVARALPHPERFVGAHPLAGGERSGPGAADAELFRGRRVLITPEAETRAEKLAECEELWRAVGAKVERMEAGAHDRVLAAVSHLPHAVAFALAAAVGEVEGAAGLCGDGFVDTTRIAGSDAVVWRDVFVANREEVLGALERFEGEMGRLRKAIAGGEEEEIRKVIERGRRGRGRVMGG